MSNAVSLPSFDTYGDYSSGNYGAHCLCFEIEGLTLWYSYKTLVAFRFPGEALVVHKNDWSVTTGKHLNKIDGGDKASRVDDATFKRLWSEQSSGSKWHLGLAARS